MSSSHWCGCVFTEEPVQYWWKPSELLKNMTIKMELFKSSLQTDVLKVTALKKQCIKLYGCSSETEDKLYTNGQSIAIHAHSTIDCGVMHKLFGKPIDAHQRLLTKISSNHFQYIAKLLFGLRQ